MFQNKKASRACRLVGAVVVALLAVPVLSVAVRGDVVFSVGDRTTNPGASGQSMPLSILIDEGEPLIVGWSAVVHFDLAVMGAVELEDLRGADFLAHTGSELFVDGDSVLMATIYSFPFHDPGRSLSSTNDGIVASINFCVYEDAPAGPHVVEILPEVAQTAGADGTTVYTVLVNGAGESRIPILEAGTLTIAGEPVTGNDCPVGGGEPPAPPPVPDSGFVLEGTFRAGDASGTQGGQVSVPLHTSANWEIRGLSFSVDFDETALDAEAVVPVFEVSEGVYHDFGLFTLNNEDDLEGNSGIAEGYVVGAIVFSWDDSWVFIPRDTEVELLTLDFSIEPDAPVGGRPESSLSTAASSTAAASPWTTS